MTCQNSLFDITILVNSAIVREESVRRYAAISLQTMCEINPTTYILAFFFPFQLIIMHAYDGLLILLVVC